MRTFDSRTIRSTGVFLESELNRRDPTLYEPIIGVTWQRDIDLREDVVATDDSTSFDTIDYAAVGGAGSNKSWAGTTATASSVSVALKRTIQGLHLWQQGASWTILELEKAQALGRPVDEQKFQAIKMKFQLDADEMVYVGDQAKGATGLINRAGIPVVGMTKNWMTATPDEILADINLFMAGYMNRTGSILAPTQLLLPPDRFTALCRPMGPASNVSILTYVSQECVAAKKNGRSLEIYDLKWLQGAGVAKRDRAVLYRREKPMIRWPHVPIQRTPTSFVGINHLVDWYGLLGEVEFVQPETVLYADFQG